MKRPGSQPEEKGPAGLECWYGWKGCEASEYPALFVPSIPSIPSVPLKGCEGASNRLGDNLVIINGLGAVGGVVLDELARCGVGTIIGTDPDDYGPESYLTQPCRPEDAGRIKSLVQGGRAHATNPFITVMTAYGCAQDLPLRLLYQADQIILTGDNLELLVWASKIGAGLGKQVIQGAVYGEQWLSIVRTFDLADPDAACPACSFTTLDWSMLKNRTGCDPSAIRAQGLEPTRTLPNICATAAGLVASESLKHLLSMNQEALASKEVAYCLRTHKVWRTRLSRNKDCRCSHESWDVVSLSRSGREATLSMLARQLGGARGHEGETGFRVRGEEPWVSFSICSGCGRSNPVRRFGRPGASIGRCSCGNLLQAIPAGIRSVMPDKDLRACLDKPLRALGLLPGAAVSLGRKNRWTWFLTNDRPEWGTRMAPEQPRSRTGME